MLVLTWKCSRGERGQIWGTFGGRATELGRLTMEWGREGAESRTVPKFSTLATKLGLFY